MTNLRERLPSHKPSNLTTRLSLAKALLKNKFTFSHPIFKPDSVAPQSQNPQNTPNIPAVLLNRRHQIWPKFGREKCEFIFCATPKRLSD